MTRLLVVLACAISSSAIRLGHQASLPLPLAAASTRRLNAATPSLCAADADAESSSASSLDPAAQRMEMLGRVSRTERMRSMRRKQQREEESLGSSMDAFGNRLTAEQLEQREAYEQYRRRRMHWTAGAEVSQSSRRPGEVVQPGEVYGFD